MSRRRRLAYHSHDQIGTILLACLIAGLLAGGVGVAALLPLVQLGPEVGEILHFGPYGQMAPSWRIDATRSPDHRRCVLQPAIMATEHGSMVVEQRLADGRTFRAHWAGGPTSGGADNCGNPADLTLRLIEMQTLLNADAASRHWHFAGF